MGTTLQRADESGAGRGRCRTLEALTQQHDDAKLLDAGAEVDVRPEHVVGEGGAAEVAAVQQQRV